MGYMYDAGRGGSIYGTVVEILSDTDAPTDVHSHPLT